MSALESAVQTAERPKVGAFGRPRRSTAAEVTSAAVQLRMAVLPTFGADPPEVDTPRDTPLRR